MIRKTLLVLLSVGLVCGLAVGAVKTIVLKDGSTYTGEVTESGGACQIKLPTGEVISYPKDKVTVSAAADPTVEYNARLGKIDPKDADGHTDIGVWAQHGGYLDLAYKEYSEALKLNPGDARATLRLQQVKDILDALAKAGSKVEITTKPVPGPGPAPGPEVAQANLIDDEDIYKIRMFEIRKREIRENPGIAIDFDKTVRADFVKKMRETGIEPYTNKNAENIFMSLNRTDQLLRIMGNSGDQGFLDRIRIKTDPEFMRIYRRDIAPQLRTSCAQDGCHGAPQGKGGFKLFTTKSDRADYTNFLILGLWARDGKYMIDRQNPEKDSLLLQHGLPLELAKAGHGHPKVQGRLPLFRGTSADNYQKFLSWIKSLAGDVPPAYRTEYQPPVGLQLNSKGVDFLHEEPTSAPASKPADDGSKDSLDK
jgi:hypothetical protein